jgi:hypothetical protein
MTRRPSARLTVLVTAAVCLLAALEAGRTAIQLLRSQDFALVADRLEAGHAVSDGTLKLLEGRSRLLIDDGICRSGTLRDGLHVLLANLERRSAATDYEGWSAAAGAAEAFALHAVSCAPVEGDFWIRLALVERAIAEEPVRLARMIRLSAELAPAEAPTLSARFALWNRVSGETHALVRDVFEQDARTVLAKARTADLRTFFAGSPPFLMATVHRLSAELPPARREELERARLGHLFGPNG